LIYESRVPIGCRFALAAGLLLSLVAGAQAPAKAPAQIQFTYENPGLDPARYTIVVDETGSGHYHSEPRAVRASDGAPPATIEEMPLPPLDAAITVSPAIRDYLFETARGHKFFATSCEDGGGKIAFQGKKTLSYQGSDGSGSCTFNWSKDERIERVTQIFEGISVTMATGAKLAVEHRHDPLELDAELGTLVDELKDGRAMEIGNIAPQLQSIVQDESVMERARSRAATLLREPAVQ
jgi:hypothetical protein